MFASLLIKSNPDNNFSFLINKFKNALIGFCGASDLCQLIKHSTPVVNTAPAALMCQLVIMELGGGTRRGSADRPEQSLRSLGPPPSGLPLHPLCTTYTKPQPPAAALTVGRTETQKCTESKSSSQSHSHTCRVPAGPYTHDVGRLQGMQSGRREARYQNPPSTAVTAPKKSSF